VLAARAAPVAPSLKVQVLLEYVLTAPPELCRARLSRDEARVLALRWFPASPPLLYKVAEDCFRRGEYRHAADLLERLVQLGETGGYDRSRRFDPGLVGDDALVNLAACYRQLGELAAAEQCYRRLLGSRHFQAQAAAGQAAIQALRHRQGGNSPRGTPS
jgi:tetratricopeptide (TPR) repeat protein